MHDPIAQVISVAALPSEPLVVCNAPFLTTLAQVEREVAGLNVATPEAAQLASDILNRLTTAGRKLGETRLAVGEPLRRKLDEINAAAKGPNERIESAKRLTKTKLDAYQRAEAEKAAAAERARLAEVARLEALARKEQEERERKAAELARLAEAERAKQAEAAAKLPPVEVETLDWDEEPAPAPEPPQKTETELALERARFAPAVVAAKPVGVAYKVFLVIESVDAAALPDTFVTREPKLAAIRQTFCVGWKDGDAIPVVPGVKFKIDRQVVSTGRSAF